MNKKQGMYKLEDRFYWDYPAKGMVYDKERCCFAEYPKHIKCLKGFFAELLFYPRHLDTTVSGSLKWLSDVQIINTKTIQRPIRRK